MIGILIIGGGVAGLSAAAELAPHAQVTLLEAERQLGYHASGRSAALFEKAYGSAVVRALNAASETALKDAGVLSPRGLMLVAGPGEEGTFATDLAAMAMTELPVAKAVQHAPCLDPAKVTRAAISADAQDIDTDRLLQHYAKAARSQGARILTGARVAALDRHGTAWQAKTDGEVFSADIVVNAAGAWADLIALLAGVRPIGLTPCRRSMARVPAPGGADPSGWPMLLGVGESWYAKPDAGAFLISPAEEDEVEPHDAWAEDMVLAEGIARYEAVAREPVTRMLSNWAGLRSFAPDRALVIGEAPESPGFFWLAGQGGYGFQSAPATARLLADHVLGRTPELPENIVSALSPDRAALRKG